MANPNVVNIIRVPGRLIANPANLTSPPTYGGTQLGIHRDMEIRYKVRTYDVRAEEYGQIPVEVIYCGQSAEFHGFARGLDLSFLSTLWPEISGSVIQENPISGVRAGTLLSTRAVKLLFAPLDDTNHPFFIMYKAVPIVPEDGAMPFTRSEEMAYPFAFRGIPDSSGRVYAMGTAGSGISL